ncbi:DUF5806 family protein [Halobellus ruber]|uniref:Uncharacterized protein n=1 Tax=Halobellus ruber TaxID=2761102 RepID=A0A7J9SIM4_9EURY|nr:DUF5806 family protein [Halobellus ruber]MBB6646804.1 hypothetical protein [Halobellus ruber]
MDDDAEVSTGEPRRTDADASASDAGSNGGSDGDAGVEGGSDKDAGSASGSGTDADPRDESTPVGVKSSAGAGSTDSATPSGDGPTPSDTPTDVRKYARFKKVDGAQYDRVNDFLRDRTYITAREWAIARLCADFRTETGVEMTKIGENLPELVPFMTDTYTPQAVNQARSSFEEKVRMSGTTFLYGAMSGFFTAEELDELMYEVTEIAKFLLEVEGVDLSVEEEMEAEERISSVMREVREASSDLRADDLSGEGRDGDPTD